MTEVDEIHVRQKRVRSMTLALLWNGQKNAACALFRIIKYRHWRIAHAHHNLVDFTMPVESDGTYLLRGYKIILTHRKSYEFHRRASLFCVNRRQSSQVILLWRKLQPPPSDRQEIWSHPSRGNCWPSFVPQKQARWIFACPRLQRDTSEVS